MKAHIDGHYLEVPVEWFDYMPEQLTEICNGVGAADQPQWMADFLSLLPYMDAAAKPHDLDYFVGGDSQRRLESDRRFRRNCFIVAKDKIGPWYVRYFTKRGRAAWAFAVLLINGAYGALRLRGQGAFNYMVPANNKIEGK